MDADSGGEEFWALRGVDFEIEKGEVVGIIGRNGAGKSTLLKILSRITEPTTGRVELRGRVASLLEVGTGFHPELSGRENIFLNGAILGMSRAEIRRKFDEIVAFAEVEKFLDTPVKHYSSGMYVRLAFAVAAHLEPEVLIIDEVLAVGDAEFQKKCSGRMGEVAREGRTVFFVSHNLGAVRSLCSRCIYLRGGAVAMDGPTEAVLEAYDNDIHALDQTVIRGIESFSVRGVRLLDEAQIPSVRFRAGGSLTVEVEYEAQMRIVAPYFWLEVHSMHGPAFGACMLFDGFRPGFLEGRGRLRCTFHYLQLMPNQYTLRMGARLGDGVRLLMDSQDVAFFNVTGDLNRMGFVGEAAAVLSADAAPVVLPYTWSLPDGRAGSFEIPRTNE